MVTIAPGSNGFATVTIRVDGIALEPDETFQLRLVTSSPPPRVFCLETLDFVIEDGNGIINNYYYVQGCIIMRMIYYVFVEGNFFTNNDAHAVCACTSLAEMTGTCTLILFSLFTCAVVNIQLTEDDYRGTEDEGSVGIVVSKDARIASSVSLTVSPVVLSEARRLNMFPMNVLPPDDNEGRSPVDAGERMYCIPQFANFNIKDYSFYVQEALTIITILYTVEIEIMYFFLFEFSMQI